MSLVPFAGRAALSAAARSPIIRAGTGLAAFNLVSDQVSQAAENARAAAREGQRIIRAAEDMISPVRNLFGTRTPRSAPRSVRRTPMTRGRRRNARMRRRQYLSRRRGPRMRAIYRVGRIFARSSVYRPTRRIFSGANRLLGPPPLFRQRTKHRTFDSGDPSNGTFNTLTSHPLIRIKYNADETLMNTRSSGSVTLRGVKVCFYWRYRDDILAEEPLVIRWWIIINRETTNPTSNVPGALDFWKKLDPDTETGDNGQDFAVTETALLRDRLQINPELYYVLRKGRLELARNNAGTGPLTGGGNVQNDRFGMINEYIPLNTMIRFPSNDVLDASDYPIDNNIWLTWMVYDKNKTQGDTGTTNACLWNYHAVNYWKDSGHR